VWPDGIVVPTPALGQHLYLRREHLAIGQLVPQLGVEALAVAILPGTTRLGEQRLHTNPAKPVTDRLGGELRPVVRPDVLRRTMLDEQVGQPIPRAVAWVRESEGEVEIVFPSPRD
jgi:hypothetical protein